MTRVSLDNINCWEEFKSYVDAMPNTKAKGDAFEQHFFNEKVPSDIPKTVQKVYKKYWKGWADFLGKED